MTRATVEFGDGRCAGRCARFANAFLHLAIRIFGMTAGPVMGKSIAGIAAGAIA